jgi:argininosuccinate lyase
MLEDLNLEEYRQFNPLIEADIFTYLEVKACVERRKVPGTSPGTSTGSPGRSQAMVKEEVR